MQRLDELEDDPSGSELSAESLPGRTTHTSDLSELRTQLSSATAQLSALSSQCEHLQQSTLQAQHSLAELAPIASQAQQIVALPGTIGLLSEGQHELKAATEALQSRLDSAPPPPDHAAALTELRSQVEALSGSLVQSAHSGGTQRRSAEPSDSDLPASPFAASMVQSGLGGSVDLAARDTDSRVTTEELARVAELVSAVSARTSSVEQQAQALAARVATQGGELAELREAAKGEEDTEHRVAAVEQQAQALAARVASQGGELAELTEAAGAAKPREVNMEQRVAAVEQQAQGLRERVAAQSGELAELREADGAAKPRVDNIEQRVAAGEQQAQGLRERVAALGGIEPRLAAVESAGMQLEELEELHNQVLAEAVAELRSTKVGCAEVLRLH